MKTRFVVPLGFAALTFLAIKLFAQNEAKTGTAEQLKRGQYIVERIANCADCHTERDWKGAFNREKWLQGAKLDFKPTRMMPWAAVAPSIAGLPSFAKDEDAVKYLETGMNSKGKQSSPPMPQYRLDHEDAVAVVAYLRSLKPPAGK